MGGLNALIDYLCCVVGLVHEKDAEWMENVNTKFLPCDTISPGASLKFYRIHGTLSVLIINIYNYISSAFLASHVVTTHSKSLLTFHLCVDTNANGDC